LAVLHLFDVWVVLGLDDGGELGVSEGEDLKATIATEANVITVNPLLLGQF